MSKAIVQTRVAWIAPFQGSMEIASQRTGLADTALAIPVEANLTPDKADAILRALGLVRTSDWSRLGRYHRARVS